MNGNAHTNGAAVATAGPSMPSSGVSTSDSARLAAATQTMMRATSRARPAPTRNPGVTTSPP